MSTLRSGFLVMAALAAVVLPAGARIGLRPVLVPGDTAPALQGPDLEGKRMRVRWAGSRLTLVNFWATWCEPCREEMPALEELQRRRAGDGFQVVGVVIDPSKNDEIRAFLEKLQITYTNLRGDPDLANLWGGVWSLPTTFLISSEGRIVRRYVGASPEQVRGLVQDVDDYLAGRPLKTMVIPSNPAVSKIPE